MKKDTVPADLVSGAEACLRHSERLLNDAKELLGKNGNISSHLLCLFALEELGKGFFLVRKTKNHERLTWKEWINIASPRGHWKKLETTYDTRDIFDAKMVKSYGINLSEILEEVARNQGARNRQEFRIRNAMELYHLKLAQMYVNIKKGSWTEPQPLNEGKVLREIIFATRDLEILKSEMALIDEGVKP